MFTLKASFQSLLSFDECSNSLPATLELVIDW